MCPPPGIVALDYDNAAARALLEPFILPGMPWQERTPDRGHVWMKYDLPIGTDWLNKSLRIGEAAIDLRVHAKGQALIPPSQHHSGVNYSWSVPFPEDPDDVPMMPDELKEMLVEAGGIRPGQASEIPDGTEAHDTVLSQCRIYSRTCSDPAELRSLTVAFAQHYVSQSRPDRFRQMLDTGELDRMVQSCWDRREGDRMLQLGQNDDRFPNIWASHFPERWAYVGEWNTYEWLQWDGSRWAERESQGERGFSGAIWRFANYLSHLSNSDERANPDHEQWTEQLRLMSAALTRTAAARGPIQRLTDRLAASQGLFDASPHLWNCPSDEGAPARTIDFKQTQVYKPRHTDHLTQRGGAAFKPGARSSTWNDFLEEAFPDMGVRRFVQAAAGYSMMGDPREDVVLFLIGVGGSGKSTFLNALQGVFGDYYALVPAAEIDDKTPSPRGGSANANLLALKGKRLAVSAELPESVHLGAKLKGLSGGDEQMARGLYTRVPTRFKPQFVLWLCGNLQPRAKAIDTGLRRRMRYIPMDATPTKVDTHLRRKLESPEARQGILQWLIEGVQMYQTDGGLIVPQAVEERSAQATAEASDLGAWMAERVVADEESQGFTATEGLKNYTAWFILQNGNRRGIPVANAARFGQEMTALGHHSHRTKIKGQVNRRFKGLRLVMPGDDEDVC